MPGAGLAGGFSGLWTPEEAFPGPNLNLRFPTGARGMNGKPRQGKQNLWCPEKGRKTYSNSRFVGPGNASAGGIIIIVVVLWQASKRRVFPQLRFPGFPAIVVVTKKQEEEEEGARC